jgi:hypothetical protein
MNTNNELEGMWKAGALINVLEEGLKKTTFTIGKRDESLTHSTATRRYDRRESC